MSCIEIKNLQFSYPNAQKVLDIKKLSIETGEKVFIHGASGSGKSTLLNLLAGVLSSSTGTLKVLGTNLVSLSTTEKDKFRGDHIGFIFQSFNLISYLSIAENISLPYRSSSKRRSQTKNLNEEIERLSKHLGLSDLMDKPVSMLSVGQQQRVAVARALIGSPDIIIADEPTSSLDDDITDDFVQLIISEHKAKNFTLLFVSHDKRLATHFDRSISLSEINL